MPRTTTLAVIASVLALFAGAARAAEPLPALNSFFNRPQEREESVTALRAFLARLPAGGPPLVLITHQYTISIFTGDGTVSGGETIFELNGSGTPRVLGAFEAN